ncbi:Kinetochore protein NDC80 like protein [Trachymyrmex septentrionalis]|uniref:Kinetochore protein NDC80 n=1 Tax=Trachymyrmex septentrionalis TaxID=34720 RepID=A0A195FFW5_9HYME|nr:PREDICTED: kinetochore protein NDC80 homolog [Trachymyrmex septentrionalis]KYN39117.1 Kinetochore protein NDC80 like protein [Trachymyrmex septentrionalis]
MQQSSVRHRSSSNPVRVSTIERNDKSLTRTDQRKTQTLRKSKGEASHIPRPRFRSSSSDRAGSLGRKSCLKTTGRTPLRQPITPITPVRVSTKLNIPTVVLTASSSKHHVSIPMGRSPSGDRASSVGIKGPRKDTRPLLDKTYQASLLNKIDNFFYVNQYSAMLNSNGSLRPITLKMFVEVSGFLLKNLGVRHALTMANYVEELPKCAEKIHYPGKIKSWLITANAPHSWSNVVGWIGWLVEACQVKEIAFNKYQLETLPFIGTEQQAQSYKMEFQALLECYEAWTVENRDEEAELLERYLQNVLVQQGITDDDIAQAQKELKQEEIKLQMHEEESQKHDEQLEYLQQKLASLRAKESQQSSNIKTMGDYIKKVSAETDQLNAERKVLKEQIRIGNIRYEELVSIVKNQPMSKIEKENIIKKCTEIQNYIHQFDEHLKDYEKELYSLDIKFATFNNNLNKAILAYNKEVFMHIDNDVGVNFEELKLPEKGLLDPRIMDIMQEKATLIKTFKEILMKQCNETESLIRSDAAKLEKLQEEIKSLPDESKLKEEISHINKMKADAKKKKAKLIKRIENLKNEIKEMQDMMPDTQTVDFEIEEARDKLDAVIRRKTFLEQAAKQFFGELYEVIGEHRRALHNILTKDRTK